MLHSAITNLDRSNVDPNFETVFNTPKIRTKFSLGSTELSDDFAFNVSARYHNAYMWESTFMDGQIPAMGHLMLQ